MSRLLLLFTLVAGGGYSHEMPVPIEVDYLAGPKIDSFVGAIKRGGEYACTGEVVTVRLASVPPSDEVLAADQIHELSKEGKVLRSWRVPLEADPVELHGGRFVFRVRRSETMLTASVDKAGHLRQEKPRRDPSRSAYSKCPRSTLPPSGYRWCLALVDKINKTSHLVAFEGPCT